MEYKIEILENKTINGKSWILCKGKLLEYLDSLKIGFYDFAIQRRIVRNQYLDSLFSTIKKGEPIPIITLTYKGSHIDMSFFDNTATINMNNIEILDGLQRSFRLWSYKNVAEYYHVKFKDNVLDYVKYLKGKSFELMFESGVMSTSIIKELINSNDILNIKETFKDFEIYFIIWVGLNETEIIRKMLVLNAGQKQVSKVHQFELLFLHIWDELKDDSKIKIKREKDINSFAIKKGQRELGEFMFSSIIISLISLVEKKPMRVSTDNLVTDEKEEEPDSEIYQKVFNQPFISKFLQNLYNLDNVINNEEKLLGKSWFVKDTTLSGFFAALGKHIDISPTWTYEVLCSKFENEVQNITNLIEEKGLNLSEFQKEYDSFSSRSVNIGNHIRKVISYYIEELINNRNPTWKDSFLTTKEEK